LRSRQCLNIAVAGVWAAYLPFRYWANSHRDVAMFVGGLLSVLVSAFLALSELLISGVRMPAAALGVSLGLFLVTGLIEGAITVGVMRALGGINPGWTRNPDGVDDRLSV
jgi:ABC-type Co2+ transport system permease subunit